MPVDEINCSRRVSLILFMAYKPHIFFGFSIVFFIFTNALSNNQMDSFKSVPLFTRLLRAL